MNKLIDIIILAIAAIAGFKNTIKSQQDTISSQQSTITDLNKQLEDAGATKAALEAAKQAQADAEAKANELQKQQDEANAKGQELADALNDHPNTPSVDENFAITEHGDPVPETAAPAPAAPAEQKPADQSQG